MARPLATKMKAAYPISTAMKLAKSSTPANAGGYLNLIRHTHTTYESAWPTNKGSYAIWTAFTVATANFLRTLAPENAAWLAACSKWEAEHLAVYYR